MKIITADKEILYVFNRNDIEIKEVYYNELLIGINLMYEEVILDTYDSLEEVTAVLKHILLTSSKEVNIPRLNLELEIL